MNRQLRILIIRLSSLGDILHTLPAFEDLKGSFPGAVIDWLVAGKAKFLLSSVRGIHATHVLDTDTLLKMPPDRLAWRQLHTLIRTLRTARYDIAIDFQGLLKSALLCRMSGAESRLGFSRDLVREPPANWCYTRTLADPHTPVHVTELNRRLAGLAGARPMNYRQNLFVSDADAANIDALLHKHSLHNFIILNPGGGWPTKRWPPEKYGLLAQVIQSKLGMQIAVTTGPGEEPLYQAMTRHCDAAALHHFPTPFLQLIPLFKRARLFVGGDTGPYHLACALGVAAVGIFGPTSPIRNGPWNSEEEYVAHNLACSPCYGRKCQEGNKCMNISVDEVFAALVRRLQKPEKESPA